MIRQQEVEHLAEVMAEDIVNDGLDFAGSIEELVEHTEDISHLGERVWKLWAREGHTTEEIGEAFREAGLVIDKLLRGHSLRN